VSERSDVSVSDSSVNASVLSVGVGEMSLSFPSKAVKEVVSSVFFTESLVMVLVLVLLLLLLVSVFPSVCRIVSLSLVLLGLFLLLCILFFLCACLSCLVFFCFSFFLLLFNCLFAVVVTIAIEERDFLSAWSLGGFLGVGVGGLVIAVMFHLCVAGEGYLFIAFCECLEGVRVAVAAVCFGERRGWCLGFLGGVVGSVLV
jgi:hypothetical protein